MEKEINNQSLFADPMEVNQPVGTSQFSKDITSTFSDKNLLIGNGNLNESTVEVKFCTGGRLSAPPVLHFKDYTMLASQELADAAMSDNHLPVMIKVLNSMVVEDFDCGKLHLEEAKEILLNILGKWWADKLTNYKYFLNPDIEDTKALTSPENISTADIPLSALEIVPLDPDVKEPINIKVHGVTVRFIYPRIQNYGIAEELLKVKYAIQEQQFHKLVQILKYNEKQVDPDQMKKIDILELEAYEDYLAEKDKWRIIYIKAQEICAVEDEVLETFEQRVDALVSKDTKISIKHWQKFNDFLEGKGKFGLKNEVEFYSDILGEKVRRPFQFHTWDLIPTKSVEFAGNVNDEISFG